MSIPLFILQVSAVAADSTSQPELSLWYLLREGGPLMIPLAICSVVGLYIFIEKLLSIKKLGKVPSDFMSEVKGLIRNGHIDAARNYCAKQTCSLAKVIDRGIMRMGKPIDVIEHSMENAGQRELYKMERRVSLLSTIADIAPMFGFLGTIAGMIILFYNVNTHGFSLESISSGIYTKMVTSAVGLIVGLLAYMGYKYLNTLIDDNVNEIEASSSDFIDFLYEPIK